MARKHIEILALNIVSTFCSQVFAATIVLVFDGFLFCFARYNRLALVLQTVFANHSPFALICRLMP